MPTVPKSLPYPLPPLPHNAYTAQLHLAAGRLVRRLPIRSDRGQATAEYALVLLGAIAIAVALFAYLKKTGHLEKMMDTIFKKVNKQLEQNVEP